MSFEQTLPQLHPATSSQYANVPENEEQLKVEPAHDAPFQVHPVAWPHSVEVKPAQLPVPQHVVELPPLPLFHVQPIALQVAASAL